MPFETLHIFARDYPGDLPWRLLAWCRNHGGVEFTVEGILTDGGSPAAFAAFDAIAEPHRRPSARRAQLGTTTAADAELWALNDDTVRALQVAFPRGFFEYFPADAWFEDLMVYRASGELLMGVVTHEGEGLLRLTTGERADFQAQGFRYELAGEWVGFDERAV